MHLSKEPGSVILVTSQVAAYEAPTEYAPSFLLSQLCKASSFSLSYVLQVPHFAGLPLT